MKTPINRPEASEHAPYYATYVNAAVAKLEEEKLADVRNLLTAQVDQLESLLNSITDEQANRAYAEGKWTLKESIVHMCDTERVFSYRTMRIARADSTPLPGFEQDDYVPESRANSRTLQDILAEFRAIRGATVALVNSLDEIAFGKVGVASGQPVSVRALCWITAGHAAHHIAITRDRYLSAVR